MPHFLTLMRVNVLHWTAVGVIAAFVPSALRFAEQGTMPRLAMSATVILILIAQPYGAQWRNSLRYDRQNARKVHNYIDTHVAADDREKLRAWCISVHQVDLHAVDDAE